MIGVQGQYLIQFDLGGQVDFLAEQDLIMFKLVEECGNVLPQFELRFMTRSSDIIKSFREGTILKVSMGKDQSRFQNMELVPIKKSIVEAQEYFVINMIGMYNALSYLMESKMTISNKISGIEAITSVVSTYFKQEITAESTDSQYWIQPNITDHNFVNQIWLHCNIPSSFPLLGITSDGWFYLKSLKEIVDQGITWNFTPYDSVDSADLLYNHDAIIEAETGFSNMWSGYNRTKSITNLSSGETESIISDPSSILAMDKNLDRATMGTRISESGILSDAVHLNYWNAYQNNLANLVLYGSTKIVLNYDNFYAPTEILDLAMFTTPDVGANSKVSVEYFGGLYIISKVVRTISHKKFTTSITMSRESLSGMNATGVGEDLWILEHGEKSI